MVIANFVNVVSTMPIICRLICNDKYCNKYMQLNKNKDDDIFIAQPLVKHISWCHS